VGNCMAIEIARRMGSGKGSVAIPAGNGGCWKRQRCVGTFLHICCKTNVSDSRTFGRRASLNAARGPR